MQLLLFCVAGEFENLHAVAQRRRDRLQRIGRSDKHHPGKVKGQIQVVIAEVIVLLGIQHLQQRRGGIATPVGPNLIDLIQHNHGVVGFDTAQRLNDTPGHRANIGAPVTANLSLVADATQRHTRKFASQCTCNRLPQRGFTDTWRPHKTQDRLAIDLPDSFLGYQGLRGSFIPCSSTILSISRLLAAL